MLIKRIASGVLIAATLATAAPTVAHAQYRDWDDGYTWGEYEGYDEGREDGYHHGNSDGYQRGHRDGYDQAWQDARDDDRYRPQYRPRCARDNGTGGLIIGGLAGGLLGRHVARDGLAGAIIGGGIGALAGRAIDRGAQRC